MKLRGAHCHHYLQVAELTFFADREFYKDWWNASTIGEYWRLWNMPVHKWMIRSVYGPVVNASALPLQPKATCHVCCSVTEFVVYLALKQP